MAARTLVLFDVDGTLVDVHGAGRRAFSRALKDTWDVDDDLSDVVFAGATDKGVLRQLRDRHALDERREPDFFRAMERTLTSELLHERPHVFDGVRLCLERFRPLSEVVLGLVTGNALRCAFVKLEIAGLDRSLFDVGGYGDEHHDRRELARVALARAERGRGTSFSRVLLVGDTPSDVQAARAIGAIAVGVTTGRYDRGALLAAGADVVVDSLRSLAPPLMQRTEP